MADSAKNVMAKRLNAAKKKAHKVCIRSTFEAICHLNMLRLPPIIIVQKFNKTESECLRDNILFGVSIVHRIHHIP